MKTVTALVLVLLCGTQTAPAFVIEMAPGEGIPHYTARGSTLAVREAPSSNAEIIARVEISAGTTVEYSATRFQTLQPGLLVATNDTEIRGRNLQARRHLTRDDYYRHAGDRSSVSVQRGDSIQYLQYRAEGTCFVIVRGDLWDSNECPALPGSAFTTLSDPIVEWWIQIAGEHVPVGWVLVDPATLLVGRGF